MTMDSSKETRLSHVFMELYRSYKRKTKTAVTWLQETCKLEDISITALVTAAKKVAKQKIQVPAELYFVFKDALELRINVAQQYKLQLQKQGMDDAKAKAIDGHDFFITKFELIFKTLFPEPPTELLSKRLPSNGKAETLKKNNNNNRFTSLASVPINAGKSDGTPQEQSAPEVHKIVRQTKDKDNSGDFLIGDPREDAICFLTYASEMDVLITDVKKLWERAANGKASIMYAALDTKISIEMAIFMTGAVVRDLRLEGFHWLVNVHLEILTNFDVSSLRPSGLKVKYPQFSYDNAFLESIMGPSAKFLEQRSIVKHAEGMIAAKNLVPWQPCRLPRGGIPDAVMKSPDPFSVMKYTVIRFQTADAVREKQSRAVVTILQDMDYHRTEMLRKARKTSVDSLTWLELGEIERQVQPLLQGLEAIIACDAADFTAEFNIWLSFFYESYNSYLWRGTEIATQTNTRLQLLQHYKEIAVSMSDFIAILDSEPEASGLSNYKPFAAMMEQLGKNKRWDLYSQAPLLNGLAMLEMNWQMMYLGINLWNDDGVAGFTLHAYNLVLKRNILKQPIPILERFCTLLHNAVFMGHRPKSNFRSALFRFMGAKAQRSGADRPRRGQNMPPGFGQFGAEAGRSHFIGAPRRLPSAFAEDRRIKPEDLTKIFSLHDSDYSLQDVMAVRTQDKDFWGKKYKEFHSKPARSPEEAEAEANESDRDCEEGWTPHTGRNVMLTINDALRSEIEILNDDDNAFPVTRINGFAAYELFRSILAHIWEKSKHVMFTPAELTEHTLMGEVTHPRVAGKGGAVVAVMMDAVDGAGNGADKLVVKGKHAKVMKMKDPKVLMELVAEAMVEAVQGRERRKDYLWKHL